MFAQDSFGKCPSQALYNSDLQDFDETCWPTHGGGCAAVGETADVPCLDYLYVEDEGCPALGTTSAPDQVGLTLDSCVAIEVENNGNGQLLAVKKCSASMETPSKMSEFYECEAIPPQRIDDGPQAPTETECSAKFRHCVYTRTQNSPPTFECLDPTTSPCSVFSFAPEDGWCPSNAISDGPAAATGVLAMDDCVVNGGECFSTSEKTCRDFQYAVDGCPKFARGKDGGVVACGLKRKTDHTCLPVDDPEDYVFCWQFRADECPTHVDRTSSGQHNCVAGYAQKRHDGDLGADKCLSVTPECSGLTEAQCGASEICGWTRFSYKNRNDVGCIPLHSNECDDFIHQCPASAGGHDCKTYYGNQKCKDKTCSQLTQSGESVCRADERCVWDLEIFNCRDRKDFSCEQLTPHGEQKCNTRHDDHPWFGFSCVWNEIACEEPLAQFQGL